MTLARKVIGFIAACCAGVLLPVVAVLYDSLGRFHRNAGDVSLAWQDVEWRGHFIWNATFIAEGSVLVGAIAGGLGLWWLDSRKRTASMHYALAGLGIGAACGVLFNVFFLNRDDPWITWPIFILLPAISATLGFSSYWLISVRGGRRSAFPTDAEK